MNRVPIVRLKNKTFRGAEPSWANACVGDNGSPQVIDYANGFAAAANVLIDQVILVRGVKLHVDEFIYPVCFNMRHAVELHLKATFEKLGVIDSLKGKSSLPDIKLASTHDLGIVWGYITEHAPQIDKRYKSRLKALAEYIGDIAAIDSTGQVFRYPFDTENKKHLVTVAVINMIVLKERFNILEGLLSDLNNLNEELITEYRCGSFTSKLSRLELFELASKLPKRSLWSSDEFIHIKATIRQEYALSSNDFSRALNVIQSNYEMSQLIDAVPSLQELTIQTLQEFFDGWVRLHDIDELKNPKPISLEIDFAYSEGVFEGIQEQESSRKELWSLLSGAIKSDQLAELSALFYFGNSMRYSEHFIEDREANKKAPKSSPDQLKESIFHLLDKTSALTNILNSLNFLGQVTMVQFLVKRYGLDGCIDRLLEESNRSKQLLAERRQNEIDLAIGVE